MLDRTSTAVEAVVACDDAAGDLDKGDFCEIQMLRFIIGVSHGFAFRFFVRCACGWLDISPNAVAIRFPTMWITVMSFFHQRLEDGLNPPL